jgi:hypothetical protein
LRPNNDKFEAIKNVHFSETKEHVQSFLRLIGYYSKFVLNLAVVACPLTDLNIKGIPNTVEWREEY